MNLTRYTQIRSWVVSKDLCDIFGHLKLQIYEIIRIIKTLLEVAFLLVELFVLGSGLLVLLVLGHQVVHVGLGLCELHLVHALALNET